MPSFRANPATEPRNPPRNRPRNPLGTTLGSEPTVIKEQPAVGLRCWLGWQNFLAPPFFVFGCSPRGPCAHSLGGEIDAAKTAVPAFLRTPRAADRVKNVCSRKWMNFVDRWRVSGWCEMGCVRTSTRTSRCASTCVVRNGSRKVLTRTASRTDPWWTRRGNGFRTATPSA